MLVCHSRHPGSRDSGAGQLRQRFGTDTYWSTLADRPGARVVRRVRGENVRQALRLGGYLMPVDIIR